MQYGACVRSLFPRKPTLLRLLQVIDILGGTEINPRIIYMNDVPVKQTRVWRVQLAFPRSDFTRRQR